MGYILLVYVPRQVRAYVLKVRGVWPAQLVHAVRFKQSLHQLIFSSWLLRARFLPIATFAKRFGNVQVFYLQSRYEALAVVSSVQKRECYAGRIKEQRGKRRSSKRS